MFGYKTGLHIFSQKSFYFEELIFREGGEGDTLFLVPILMWRHQVTGDSLRKIVIP